jgi:hypothetical protein
LTNFDIGGLAGYNAKTYGAKPMEKGEKEGRNHMEEDE